MWTNKKHALLVPRTSATRYCTRWNDGVDHESPIALNHSDMVKFKPSDDKYDNVRVILQEIAKRARVREPKIDGTAHALMQTTPQHVHPSLRLMGP